MGLDIVPCQVDLAALAGAERLVRASSEVAVEDGLGEGVEKRITWDRGNLSVYLSNRHSAWIMLMTQPRNTAI